MTPSLCFTQACEETAPWRKPLHKSVLLVTKKGGAVTLPTSRFGEETVRERTGA